MMLWPIIAGHLFFLILVENCFTFTVSLGGTKSFYHCTVELEELEYDIKIALQCTKAKTIALQCTIIIAINICLTN